MARKALTELRYFPVDVNRVRDTKLRSVARAKGWVAYYIYDVLLSMIYGDKGYYLDWTEDALMEIADCAHCDDKEVTDILQEMFRRNLFSTELFATKAILTSAGIQRRYLQAMKDRVRKIRSRGGEMQLFRPEYQVLSDQEIKSILALNGKGLEETGIELEETGIVPDETGFVPDDNDKLKETKPKEMERRVEQRRGEETTDVPFGTPNAPSAPPALQMGSITLNQMEYEMLCTKFGKELVEAKAARLDAWIQERVKRVVNCFTTLRAWLSEDAIKEKEREKEKGMEKERQSPPPKPAVGKRTGAHNFTQRVYVDEDMESIFSDPDELLRLVEDGDV